jgi:ABC-2 type transport system permease protein
VRETLLIIKREFRERVASKSFVAGTLLFPMLMIGLLVLPRLVGSGASDWDLALVSDAPAGVTDVFEKTLTAPPEDEDAGEAHRYRLIRVEGPVSSARERLAARLDSEELDGYIALPADVLQSGSIVFRARKGGSFDVIRDLRRAGTRAVQSERLRQSGIDASAVAALVAPVEIDEARLTEAGEQRGGALSTFLTAYVVAFLIYIMTTLYGVAVMRSVLEEKTNRIAEVLMSTIRASHLMAGKIIGVGSAAVIQVLIWVAITALVVKVAPRLGGGFSLPDPLLQALNVPPGTGVLLFLYFLLGFFLYASVFAIVGAAVTSEQEAQSVQFIALIPMIAPMLFLQTILNAPLGGAAIVMGLIPFTSPVTMPMRMASTQVPALEVIASLILLVVGIVVVAWVAGKVYRVGILSTGKRPSLGELVQWVRSA